MQSPTDKARRLRLYGFLAFAVALSALAVTKPCRTPVLLWQTRTLLQRHQILVMDFPSGRCDGK